MTVLETLKYMGERVRIAMAIGSIPILGSAMASVFDSRKKEEG